MPTRRISAAFAFVLVAACRGDANRSTATGDVGGTVIVSTASDADYLLPPIISNVQGKMATDLIFEKLAEIGPEMNAFGDAGWRPRLAKRWTWGTDSLTLTFELDPRARWHDGTPVRAEDVKLGFDLIKDPRVNSPYRPNVAEMDSVSIRDSLTAMVWYNRRTPDQFFAAAYNIVPVPAHLLRDEKREALASAAFARNPVGNARFRFVRWVPNQLIEFVADTANFRGRAKLDRIVISVSADPGTAVTRLLAGEADFFEVLRGEQIDQANASPILRTVTYGGVDYAGLQFNLRDPARPSRPHPVFGDRALRRALSMALDREAILKNVFDTLAFVPYGMAPRSLGVIDSSIRQLRFDTAAARHLLDSLGWRAVNGDGVRERNGVALRFGLMVPSSSRTRQRSAVLLQEQLKQSGVDVQIEQLDFNAFIDKMNSRKFDAMLNAWHADPSPSSIRQAWTTTSSRSRGANVSSYENPRFDALVDSAVGSRSPDRARVLYRSAYQLLVDDAPVIMLYEPILIAGAHKRVRLVELRPDAWWAGMADWWIPASERIDRDRVGLRPASQ